METSRTKTKRSFWLVVYVLLILIIVLGVVHWEKAPLKEKDSNQLSATVEVTTGTQYMNAEQFDNIRSYFVDTTKQRSYDSFLGAAVGPVEQRLFLRSMELTDDGLKMQIDKGLSQDPGTHYRFIFELMSTGQLRALQICERFGTLDTKNCMSERDTDKLEKIPAMMRQAIWDAVKVASSQLARERPPTDSPAVEELHRIFK